MSLPETPPVVNSESSPSSSEEENLGLAKSAKILLTRAGRTVQSTAKSAKDSASSTLGSLKESTSTNFNKVKDSVSDLKTPDLSKWNPFKKLPDINEIVQQAKELNSTEDVKAQLEQVVSLITMLEQEKTELIYKLYKTCPHTTVVKVKMDEGLLKSTPPYKLCKLCGIAEEGQLDQTGYIKLTEKASDLPREEADKLVIKKFSQKELKSENFKNNIS